jgi:4-phytase/acid phosphatase
LGREVGNKELKNGRFSYASMASEAFLLEYANGMPNDQVAWDHVAPPNQSGPRLQDILRLHELYFDQTDRRPYIAQMQASNLIKEINDLIRRKAGWSIDGCPHADADSDFVGLVGHDTNLAGVGKLLDLGWRFDKLPDDTQYVPANDALPGGALVFELRRRGHDEFVRVSYLTYGLTHMRWPSDREQPFVVPVEGAACGSSSPCDIPLGKFVDLLGSAVNSRFLSACVDGKQQCPRP